MKSTSHIYKHLSPSAAAMVAWGLTHAGQAEAENVAAAVPREYRYSPALEFGETIFWLQALAQGWSVAHWSQKCEMERTKAAFALSSTDADMVAALHALRVAEGRLMACDLALDLAAAAFGFDAETVRGIAQAVRYVPMVPDVLSDEGFALELQAAITGKSTGA